MAYYTLCKNGYWRLIRRKRKMSTQYDKEIGELEDRIKVDRTRLGVVRTHRAVSLCPYTVGQRLVDGKGKQAEITAITPDYYTGYNLEGCYVLKDGGLGKASHRLYDLDNWKSIT